MITNPFASRFCVGHLYTTTSTTAILLLNVYLLLVCLAKTLDTIDGMEVYYKSTSSTTWSNVFGGAAWKGDEQATPLLLRSDVTLGNATTVMP